MGRQKKRGTTKSNVGEKTSTKLTDDLDTWVKEKYGKGWDELGEADRAKATQEILEQYKQHRPEKLSKQSAEVQANEAVRSGDLPEEWKARLQEIKGFPDELLMEPYDLEIEQRKIRSELLRMARIWTVAVILALVYMLLAQFFGDAGGEDAGLPPRYYFLIIVFLLGVASALWVLTKHRFYLGDPVVRALDLTWIVVGGPDEDDPDAELLQSACNNLLQYALRDEDIRERGGFDESRFVQSWIRQQQYNRERPDCHAKDD
jgi:hypothetical protein